MISNMPMNSPGSATTTGLWQPATKGRGARCSTGTGTELSLVRGGPWLLQALQQLPGRVAVRSQAQAALVVANAALRGRSYRAVGRAAVKAVCVQCCLQRQRLAARQRQQVARPGSLHRGAARELLRQQADGQRVAGRVVVAQDRAKVRADQEGSVTVRCGIFFPEA